MATNLKLNWLIAIALTGWLMYLLAPVLTPFVAAALLAYIGDPLADRLQQWKLPRTLAVVAVFILTFLSIGLLLLLVVPLIRTQVGALFDALPEIVRQFEEVWLPNIAGYLDIDPGEDIGIGAFLSRYSDMAGSWGTKVLMSVTKSGSALAAAVFSLFLVPILTFYMLRDWDSILAHLSALLPEPQRDTIVGLARESDEVLGGFLRGQLLVAIIVGVMLSLGYWIIDLPFWLLIGLVGGVLGALLQLLDGLVLDDDEHDRR